jgi:hypothetical protein
MAVEALVARLRQADKSVPAGDRQTTAKTRTEDAGAVVSVTEHLIARWARALPTTSN